MVDGAVQSVITAMGQSIARVSWTMCRRDETATGHIDRVQVAAYQTRRPEYTFLITAPVAVDTDGHTYCRDHCLLSRRLSRRPIVF